MDTKTYRAKTMQEALALVREQLGPEASVLRTREVRPRGWARWWGGAQLVEVVASATERVPSRLPAATQPPLIQPIIVPRTQAGIELDGPFVEAALAAACSPRATAAWQSPQNLTFLALRNHDA